RKSRNVAPSPSWGGPRRGRLRIGLASSAPQEALGDFGVGDEFGTRAGEAVLAGGEDEAARGEGQRLPGVLLDHQDGNPGLVDLDDLLEDFQHVARAEAGRGL